MLYSTAGSRLFISEHLTDDLPASRWIEIAGVEAIGLLGVEWDVETVDLMDCDGGPDDPVVEEAYKTVMRRPEMPLVFGNDPTDPGQLILWRAAHSYESFPFRLVFPDGSTERTWSALVIRIGEVFDTANSVMRLQADLKPVSQLNGGRP